MKIYVVYGLDSTDFNDKIMYPIKAFFLKKEALEELSKSIHDWNERFKEKYGLKKYYHVECFAIREIDLT